SAPGSSGKGSTPCLPPPLHTPSVSSSGAPPLPPSPPPTATMINFELSEQQQALQKLARDFARDEIRPVAAHHDETGEWPDAVLRKAWELGLVNVHIPASVGGLGLGTFDGALIDEEMGWGCTGIATAMTANSLAQV